MGVGVAEWGGDRGCLRGLGQVLVADLLDRRHCRLRACPEPVLTWRHQLQPVLAAGRAHSVTDDTSNLSTWPSQMS